MSRSWLGAPTRLRRSARSGSGCLTIKRTAPLRQGHSLSQVTCELTRVLGIDARVLPMSDDPVRTHPHTSAGVLGFPEYLVGRRAAPKVMGVEYRGIDAAAPARVCWPSFGRPMSSSLPPASPVASIGPILALHGVLDALRRRDAPTIAVAPVVRGREPHSTPDQTRASVRGALMESRGLEHHATEVASLYASFVDGFVLDRRDAGEVGAIEALGMKVCLMDTLAPPAERSRWSPELLSFAAALGEHPRSATSQGRTSL